MYRLNLPIKIKIYPIQHIVILELVYRNTKLLVYKKDIYRGQEEDKQEVLKIISYKDINKETWYKVKQVKYKEITQELVYNLKNAIRKVQEYQKKKGLGNIKKELKIKGLVKGNR